MDNKDKKPKEEENKSEKKGQSLEEKYKENEDKLLRTLAELENQRRRFEKEIKEAFTFGGFNFAKETLPLLDNLSRAKISIKNDQEFKDNNSLDKFLKHIDVIEKDLEKIFEKNNIQKIQSINKKFDPNSHQAMLEVEDDSVEPGTVVQEIQPGYMFGERLLRPSLVGISKKKVADSKKNDAKN